MITKITSIVSGAEADASMDREEWLAGHQTNALTGEVVAIHRVDAVFVLVR